jgi:predicted nicotinamide N-methyase
MRRFILDHTVSGSPRLVPEIRLRLADDVVNLWQETEKAAGREGLPPPYWAFAWPGGQALARYVLDHPQCVRGKRVLDFGAGSGLLAIAAAKAGAGEATAADIDPFAAAAIALNAEANGASIRATAEDTIGRSGWQTVLVGDMCYERPLAERLLAWLSVEAKAGVLVLLGDPGRNYFPKSGPEKLASYDIRTPLDLEDSTLRKTGVYRLA